MLAHDIRQRQAENPSDNDQNTPIKASSDLLTLNNNNLENASNNEISMYKLLVAPNANIKVNMKHQKATDNGVETLYRVKTAKKNIFYMLVSQKNTSKIKSTNYVAKLKKVQDIDHKNEINKKMEDIFFRYIKDQLIKNKVYLTSDTNISKISKLILKVMETAKHPVSINDNITISFKHNKDDTGNMLTVVINREIIHEIFKANMNQINQYFKSDVNSYWQTAYNTGSLLNTIEVR